VRETVNYNCDRRRHLDDVRDCELVGGLGVDFSHMDHPHDAIWDHYEERLGSHDVHTGLRESAEVHVVADRARSFFDWLMKSRDEDHVVVCSHAACLRCLWNFGHPSEINPNGPVGTSEPQVLDSRGDDAKTNVPVVRYCGGVDGNHDEAGRRAFEESMRRDYDNCELRSVVLAYRED